MKLCKDCRHTKPWLFIFYSLAKCSNPKAEIITNPVSGTKEQVWKFCASHRTMNIKTVCGKNGEWWEPKNG